MSNTIQSPQIFLPITNEHPSELGVDSQFVEVLKVEQSSGASSPLTKTETRKLTDLKGDLETVLSSGGTNPDMRSQNLKLLRKAFLTHGILPASYHLAGVVLRDPRPSTSVGYADVWEAQLPDDRAVSVKTFRAQLVGDLEKIKQRFYCEIIEWKYVSHQNLVPVLGVSEICLPFCIINPWLENGDILKYLDKNPEANRLELLSQAACGLKHLHSINIVHGDINPATILIDDSGGARLGDFGFASLAESSRTVATKQNTVRYMAPELIYPQGFGLQGLSYTKKSDIYSFGMTVYQVLTEIEPYKEHPYAGAIIADVIVGKRPPRPQNTPWLHGVWPVIVACWNQERDQRWDMPTVHARLPVTNLAQDTRPEVEHEVSQPEGEHEVSQPQGEHGVSQPQGEHEVSQPQGEHEVSQPEGEHEVSQPQGEHEVSQPQGEHEVSQPQGEHEASQLGMKSEASRPGTRVETAPQSSNLIETQPGFKDNVSQQGRGSHDPPSTSESDSSCCGCIIV